MKTCVLILVAGLALALGSPVPLRRGNAEGVASDGTAVLVSGGTTWTSVATLGSCSRCGRTVSEPFGADGNKRLVIWDRDQRERFRGCWECLLEVLDRSERK